MRKTIGLFLGAFGVLVLTLPALAADLYGTLKRIDESGTLRIGYREASPPFSFLGPDGQPTGYSVELCLHVANRVKETLNLDDLKLDLIPVTSANRIDKLVDGTIDIECGSTSHTLERRARVDFSYFTFLTGTRLLTKKDSAIHDYADLADRTVAVTKGTTNAARIEAMRDLLKIKLTLLPVDDHDAGLAAVREGKADAYATDDILLRGLLRRADDGDNFALVGNFLTYDPYALMLRRDDSAFRLLVDKTLADLFFRRDLEKVFDKWFAPLGVPLTGALLTTMTAQMHVN